MNELQLRLEVRESVQNYVDNMLFASGIPAHILEDAFTSSLGYIKDRSLAEFLESARVETVAREGVSQETEEEGEIADA